MALVKCAAGVCRNQVDEPLFLCWKCWTGVPKWIREGVESARKLMGRGNYSRPVMAIYRDAKVLAITEARAPSPDDDTASAAHLTELWQLVLEGHAVPVKQPMSALIPVGIDA